MDKQNVDPADWVVRPVEIERNWDGLTKLTVAILPLDMILRTDISRQVRPPAYQFLGMLIVPFHGPGVSGLELAHAADHPNLREDRSVICISTVREKRYLGLLASGEKHYYEVFCPRNIEQRQ